MAASARLVIADAPVHGRDRRPARRVVVDLAVSLRLGDGAEAACPVGLGDVAESLPAVRQPDFAAGDRVAELGTGAYRRPERAGLNRRCRYEAGFIAAPAPGRPSTCEERRPGRRALRVGGDAEFEGVTGCVSDIGLGQRVV